MQPVVMHCRSCKIKFNFGAKAGGIANSIIGPNVLYRKRPLLSSCPKCKRVLRAHQGLFLITENGEFYRLIKPKNAFGFSKKKQQ